MADDVHYVVGGDAEGLKGALEEGAAGFEKLFAVITGGVASGEALNHMLEGVAEKFGEFLGDSMKFLPESVNKIGEYAIEMGKLSTQMQTTTEQASLLDQVATRTGTSIDTMATAVYRFNARLEDTGTKGDVARTALDRIGLSYDDLKSKDPVDRFLELTEAMHGAGDAASVAADLFGTKFGKQILTISGYDIPDLIKNIKDLGMLVSQQTVDMARQYEEGWANITGVWKAAEFEIGNALLPAFSGIADMVGHIAVDAWKQLQDANSPLMLTLEGLRTALFGASDGATFAQQVFDVFVNILLKVVDGVKAVVDGAISLGKAWYEAKTVFDSIVYGIMGGITLLDEAILTLLENLAKIPGMQTMYPALAATIVNLRDEIVRASDSQAAWGKAIDDNQTHIANLDAIGQATTKSIDGFKNSVVTNAAAMREHLGASDDSAKAFDRHGKAAKQAADYIDEYTKSVYALQQTIDDQTAFVQLDRLIDVYDRLGGAANMSWQAQDKLATAWGKIRDIVGVDAAPGLETLYQMYDGLTQRQKDEEAATAAFSKTFIQGWKDMAFASDANGGTVAQMIDTSTKRMLDLDKALADMSLSAHQRALNDLADQKAIDLAGVSDLDVNAAAKRAIINDYYDKLEQRVHTDSTRTKDELGQQLADAQDHYDAVTAIEGEFTDQEIADARKRLKAAQDEFDGKRISGDQWFALVKGWESQIGGALTTLGTSAGLFGDAWGKAVGSVTSSAGGLIDSFKAIQKAAEDATGDAVGAAGAGGLLGAVTAIYAIGVAIGKASEAQEKAEFISREAKNWATDLGQAAAMADDFGKKLIDMMSMVEHSSGDFVKNWPFSPVNAANMGSIARTTAEALLLNDAIKEMGGAANLTGKEIANVYSQMNTLLYIAKDGGDLSKKAIDSLDTALTSMGQAAVANGGMVDAQFLKMVKDADDAGVHLAQVTKFVTDQAMSSMTGLETFLKGATVSTQANASAMGDSVAAVFGKLTAGGTSIIDALAQLKSPINDLLAQLNKTGLDGGQAFNQIVTFSQLASDKVAGPALSAVGGLNQMLLGLHNSGLLNQSMFAGLTDQVGQTFSSLIKQGFDGNQVLALMQPTLQTIWQQEQQFGYKTDEATQKLIDQGVESGIVGAQHKSAQELMQDALSKTADAITYIAQLFGYTAKTADDSTKSIQTSLGNNVINTLNGPTSTAFHKMGSDAEDASIRAAVALRDKVQGELNNTQANIYGPTTTALATLSQNGIIVADNIGTAFNTRVGSALNNVRNEMDNTPWRDWQQRGVDAANTVESNVDALSFGRSPTGFAGLIGQIRQAGDVMSSVAPLMVGSLGTIDYATNVLRDTTNTVYDTMDHRTREFMTKTLDYLTTMAQGAQQVVTQVINGVSVSWTATASGISTGITDLVAKVSQLQNMPALGSINTVTAGQQSYTEAQAIAKLQAAAMQVSGRTLNPTEIDYLGHAMGYAGGGTINASVFNTYLNQLVRTYTDTGSMVPHVAGAFDVGGAGDFGSGMWALLHGREAILPLDRDSEVGVMLARSLVRAVADVGPNTRPSAAGIASAANAAPLVMQVQSPIFLNESTMRQFADLMTTQLARGLTREMTFEIQPGG